MTADRDVGRSPDSSPYGSGPAGEVAREQSTVDTLYGRLDDLRESTAEQLARARLTRSSGSAQNRSERDAFATMYERRLSQLRAVEDRLVFGRLDLQDGGVRYIGRIGLSDDDRGRLLVDWRAPAAEDFYRATAAAPGGVVRRRHLAIRDRRVTGVEDELLDLDSSAGRHPDVDREGLVLNGEGALMAALTESRTGRMRDIVSTIQAEQDRIIRAPLAGILVVQGGPGTGKTAVALHRAAYLLYTHRDRIARSGVLVVGPSPVFLRYIDQVLPSLGESGVVLATPGQLFPGVDAVAAEDPRATALKGDLRMVEVLRRALATRQRVPAQPVPVKVEGTELTLRPRAVAAARESARSSGRPHNAARVHFVRQVLDSLVSQLARAQKVPLSPDSRLDLLSLLRDAPDVRREVNLCWMPLTPQRLVAGLWEDRSMLAAAAPHLSADQRALLHRAPGTPWSAADVPLLDEAAEILGADDSADRLERRRQAAERAEEIGYARGALEVAGAAGGLVTAEMLADRFAESGSALSVADRAVGDRSWAYGHVVVDEAQELSPMAWRALMRRCPSRSMTVVGDPAQTAALAGSSRWGDALNRYAPDRWRLEELTVNYRTPAEIMTVAADVLIHAGVPVRPPRPARSGSPPVAVRAPAVDLDAVERVVRRELEDLGGGRLAVVTPRVGYGTVPAGLADRFPVGTVRAGAGALQAQAVVLDVGAAKGLEFDTVVLLEPADVLEQSPRGANDLYVALTRPTRRLVVMHCRPLPPGMDSVGPDGAP